jgi:hypothetical protein
MLRNLQKLYKPPYYYKKGYYSVIYTSSLSNQHAQMLEIISQRIDNQFLQLENNLNKFSK